MTEFDFHDGPEPKRRKVRKGTQSCWECKRRKVRCIFASSEVTICNNCRRRGTVCIGQEQDSPEPSGGSQVEVRLSRVERLLEHKYEGVARDLVAAWPSQAELDIIFALPAGLSTYMHCGIFVPHTTIPGSGPPSPQEMLQLPPPGSHPVLIARQLLILGTFLQSVPPPIVESLGEFSSSYRDIMSRVLDRAVRLVNANEDLNGSVEGIECIMIEATYQNYAGNLHRAWMAVRRAASVAQMMALHRGLSSPSLKFLTPQTRASFDPDNICLRLAEMDRYLSLMLGLPPASIDNRFAAPKALEACQPFDRMQRIHCVLSGRILQRTDCDLTNLSLTSEIDRLLQKNAAEMPPQWWLIPQFRPDNTKEQNLDDTARLMQQFSHFYLLIRLHLPYMPCPSTDRRYDASKTTAVTGSREILARYVVFRASNPGHFYCRGSDFLAFVATTVMCLAHIDSHSQRQAGTRFNPLFHSRPSDRGMMERTLEILQSMTRAGTDEIACRLAPLIRQLLAIEANAASGTIYSTNSSAADEGTIGCGGKLTNGGQGLNIHIPYFGTITFEHGIMTNDMQYPPMDLPGPEDWDMQGVDLALFDSLFRGTAIPDADEEQPWAT
ncbi:hypothetical protein BO70DRAFT_309756 [Aspergillus heteromorphus CBS 117.55]|uniref:Zn(2)-C6 fungal-type domain-containing protein n=1 Tax=Aspergillus heteromorphus CBS 117.55 TaxID=1448321 RepID=A0A317WVB1_9EURO|nr:uncharacterized protein BO70DRAFT_309756 [Aspergillus heteromorphus CBS 117.55]PWY88210.1 hypothetical protein BO70DRAFT_309756 [Aspergillus heteromorphus CBS 117.55]